MKRGTNFHLRVNLEGLKLEEVEKVEFVFKPAKDDSVKALKTAEYPGTVTKEGNDLLIPFSSAETYDMPSRIFMDTRISVLGTTDQPATEIIELKMNQTLFGEVV